MHDKKIRQKILLFCVKRAKMYVRKGGTNNIIKGINWAKKGMRFMNDEQKEIFNMKVMAALFDEA